jgi:hypothetical protein
LRSIDFPTPMPDLLFQRPALVIKIGDFGALGMLLGSYGDNERTQRIKLFGLPWSPG